MGNFKNSVKTINENSQAVQTKARSLRAFWRILIKENTVLHCKADVSEHNSRSVLWELVDWWTEGTFHASHWKLCVFCHQEFCFWEGVARNTLIFFLATCGYISQISWECISVRHLNKTTAFAVWNNERRTVFLNINLSPK